MAPKRKNDQTDGEADEEIEKKPRAKAAKKKATAEPYTAEDGWTMIPPSLLFRDSDVKPSSKIAAFDLDGTLAVVKGRSQYPTDENDWKYFNKNVPKELQSFHEKGFKIVIFSNQNGIKTALEGKMATKLKGRIVNILADAAVPAQVFYATGQDQYRKPEKGMWDYWLEHGNGGQEPDYADSFFVGDAAGRTGDFADSDKQFAANAGLPFKTPEEVFGEGTVKKTAPTKLEDGAVNQNEGMSAAFRQLADMNQEKGGNHIFAARTFYKVEKIIAAYPTKIESGKELKSVAGVGKGSIEKIDEFIKTGTFAALTEAQEGVEGGDAEEKGKAVASKGQDMALKFL